MGNKDIYTLEGNGRYDLRQAMDLIRKAYSTHDMLPNQYPAVTINLQVTVERNEVSRKTYRLEDVFELESPINEIAKALYYSGITSDDLIMLEADLRAFIPANVLHPTQKFTLHSSQWYCEDSEYDTLWVGYPLISTPNNVDADVAVGESLFLPIWHRVHDGESQHELYRPKGKMWNKINIENFWCDL